jgi:hypothetical protein
MDWLVNKFLLKYVKGILDKIPPNGLKTALGVLLLVLGELAKVYGGTPYGATILWAINFANSLGGTPDTVVNIGLGGIIIGLVHKILKLLKQEKDDEVSMPVIIQ